MGRKTAPLADRELSWLAFNARVLQEAEDPTVPVGDRLDFLAIVSSNLDEFFRVRVASLRSLLRLGKKTAAELGVEPRALLAEILRAVDVQQTRFGVVLREQVLPALRERGILLVDERQLGEAETTWLRTFFEREVRPRITVLGLDQEPPPFLENRGLYLAVALEPAQGPRIAAGPQEIALVAIPPAVPRWVCPPAAQGERTVLFLDDVIRLCLPALFPAHAIAGAWSVKLTRDAELSLEDEFSADLVTALRRALAKRSVGVPSRFLYDPDMPDAVLSRLRNRLGLEAEDLFRGGRYHNLHDLFAFPRFDPGGLRAPPLPPLPVLDDAPSILAAVAERDRLLHFPYQSFEPVLRFLREAAEDADVDAIWITLYRVAKASAVVDALAAAAKRGKAVTAVIEVKARFDEEANLDAAARLEAAGARVVYSDPELKVHAKLALVSRREGGESRLYGYFGTGNFNENTARIYADHALLTADTRLTRESRRVFAYLLGETEEPRFKHLMVAPFGLRRRLRRLVNAEKKAALGGKPAAIVLKLNSLEDPKSIRWLYDASAAGVPIVLIVRGICRLVAGLPGVSETIEIRSIVDRFLEHARVYRFYAGGKDRVFLSSADWMTRNLDRRVEVAFPIYDESCRAQLMRFLELQLADTVKARRIDAEFSNTYVRDGSAARTRAQLDAYTWLAGRGEKDARKPA